MIKELVSKIKRKYKRKQSNRELDSTTELPHLKNHICVLFCYQNFEHIKQCFNSIYDDKTDYFIVENYSSNSNDIKEYFLGKRLIGYIQFEQNITNNAANIFLRDFKHKLIEYKYTTFSDCDLLVHSKELLFGELFDNLEHKNVLVSCADLEMENLPNVKGSENWIPKSITTDIHIEGFTGIHFLTIKNENLDFFEKIHFLDTNLHLKCKKLKKKWVKTLKNKVYHLTWDIYFDGNDYFEFKVKNFNNLWNHKVVCDYKIIV
mgnify:CR=1 FL=1